MRIVGTIFAGLLIIALAISCSGTKTTTTTLTQAGLYIPGATALHPEFLVFHQNDTLSQLTVKLYTDELLFNQANPENILQALVKITFEMIDITDDPNNKQMADSGSMIKKIEKASAQKGFGINLMLKTKYGRIYSLRVNVKDLLRKTEQLSYVSVNKLTKFGGQNFKMISVKNNGALFRSYIYSNEAIMIITNTVDTKKLFIKYQKDKTSFPTVPYSTEYEPNFEFKADSTWVYPYNPSQTFIFNYNGLYLIQTDSTQNEGLYVVNASDDYPRIKEPQAMIPPLEYLTTNDEFVNLQKSNNKKLAIDNFWLKQTGKTDIAKEQIRIYYTRQFYANIFFTSFKEGWKTDRGMVYIMFGPPSEIKKTPVSEIWEYNLQNENNLNITFNKVQNPYSENHFVMQRNDLYSSYWHEAIDTWRKGKIFSIEE